MKLETFSIGAIPAVLYGAPSNEVWLFLHGQSGCKEEGERFGEIVCPKGQQVLAIDLPEHGQRKNSGEVLVPWVVDLELKQVLDFMKSRWGSISVRANSIGAYFGMLSLPSPKRALLVSPVLNLERVILDMMGWANVTEAQLQEQGEIPTSFGQTLSWKYLCYVREHPIHNWDCPIHILYAGQDSLIPKETVDKFMEYHQGKLTVLEQGEHWFHTPEQLAALKAWEMENCGD